MVRTRYLWLGVLGLDVLLSALPGMRDATCPRDRASWAGPASGAPVLAQEDDIPGLLHAGWPAAPADATAKRLGAAWAYQAAAEVATNPADARALLDQAVQRDPRDEVILLARAEQAAQCVDGTPLTVRVKALHGERVAASRPAAADLARLELTTAELVRAYPDNAFGRWLRAFSLASSGGDEAAERELRVAAACPRLRTGYAERMDRWRRFSVARGLPWVEAAASAHQMTWPALSRLRDVARWAGARAHDLPDRKRAADLSLAVCRFGVQVRDADVSLLEMLAGCAYFALGERDPAQPTLAKPAGLSREAEIKWYAQHYVGPFAERLRQSGRADAVAWVTAEAERCAAVKVTASREVKLMTRPAATTTATAVALVFGRGALATAALVLLLHAAVWEVLRRRAAESLVPWRLRELIVLSLAAAGPLALAMVLVYVPVVRAAVVDEQGRSQLQHWPFAAVFALFGLSLVAVPLLLGALARAYARRGTAEGGGRTGRRALHRHFCRRALPGAFAGSAALLMGLAFLANVALTGCRAHYADLIVGVESRGTVPARQAVRAIPAPEPPADLRPARR